MTIITYAETGFPTLPQDYQRQGSHQKPGFFHGCASVLGHLGRGTNVRSLRELPHTAHPWNPVPFRLIWEAGLSLLPQHRAIFFSSHPEHL